ncbi:hypothetical protein NDU88_008543 [Pleurodeles waltl]|uniref:Uncharacterized protein n=1 Tax=Pleurodeles waltl TaxID=8319 RepID=A0AAV7RXY4_PLEWA|nr:hypothetical protein NDU88_008543 [Pleurodeles waltl]
MGLKGTTSPSHQQGEGVGVDLSERHRGSYARHAGVGPVAGGGLKVKAEVSRKGPAEGLENMPGYEEPRQRAKENASEGKQKMTRERAREKQVNVKC